MSSARRTIFDANCRWSRGCSGIHPRAEISSRPRLHPHADDNGSLETYSARMADSNTQSSSAPRDQGPMASWLRPLGVATIALVVALSLREHPTPALHGDGLGVTVALIVLVASIVSVVRRPSGRWSMMLAPVTMIGASSALVWTQSGGPAIAGLFVAVSYAALRLPLPGSLAMLTLAVLTLVAAAVHAERTAGLIVSAELGVVAFYMLSIFARRIQDAHEQTARLLAELQASRRSQEEAAALRERSRIAREIHDVLAHSLSGLMLQLEGARMLAETPNANGQLPGALARAHRLAHAGLEEARRAISALRDDELPGPDRLQRLAADFSRDSSIETTLEITGLPRQLDSQTSLTLFRVAQEALTNSRIHSQAQRVELHLAYEPDGIGLVIEDHDERTVASARVASGRESRPPDGARHGYGLTGMRERAELLGGRLEASPTGDGFRVELWIPA
jgi:signal transduction histidine kinase